jgi:GntR family transcriptional regulator
MIGFMTPVNRGRRSASQTSLGLTQVDRDEATFLHDQVAAEIRRAIAMGEAQPGERIPQAKDLAAVLGVNTNTVLRALRILRDEGLLEFRRGRGITVAGTPERSAVLSRVREMVAFARHHGYRPEEVIDMIESLSSPPARARGGAT